MDAARVFRIGRDPDNDIVIEHGSVSRNHCELRLLDDGAVLLVDLDSMNGTAVRQNGQWEHVEQATVERDERILLGEIVTTVAALLARAPKAAAPRSTQAPRPRKLAKPTAVAESGLFGRLVGLSRRVGGERAERDEPSICLPAFVSVPEVEEPARLVRHPPVLPTPRRPKAAVAKETAANAPAPTQFDLPLQPVAAPALTDPAPPPPAAARIEPSLRVASAPEAAAPAQPAPAVIPATLPAPISPPPKPRTRARPVAFGHWAIAAAVLLVASAGTVAAYFTYVAPNSEARIAAAPKPASAPAATHAPDSAPPPAPRPAERRDAPPAKAADPGKAPSPKTTPPLHARASPWHRRIEATAGSAIVAAAPTREGFCLAGSTVLPGGGQEAWVVRLDAGGTLRWQRRPGGPKRDAALATTADGDGGCVAAGYDNDENRLWIFRLDASGAMGWNRTIQTGHSGRAVAIVRTADGGFAVAAHAKAAPGRPDRAFVLRLSPRGDIKWSRYVGDGESLPTDLREMRDGGFVVAGMARERGNAQLALWVGRMDRKGHTLWEQHFGGPGTPAGAHIDIARGDELVVAATMLDGSVHAVALRLMRISAGGKVLWDRRIGDGVRRAAGMILVRGGILVAGDSGTEGGQAPELWLAQFDAGGRTLKESRLPMAKGDRAAALIELRNGRLVLAGTAEQDAGKRRGAGLIFVDRDRQLAAER
jgi:hypothetical protein